MIKNIIKIIDSVLHNYKIQNIMEMDVNCALN